MENNRNNIKPLFFNGGRLICPSSWKRNLHSHSFYQIIIIYQGKMTVSIDDEIFIAEAGDVVFYPQKTPHKEWNSEEIPLEIIYLDWEGPDINPPRIIHDNHGRIRILSEWILSDYKNSIVNQEKAEDNMLQTILYEVEKNAFKKIDDFVQKVKISIFERLDKSLSLEILANIFNMNKYTFLRKYKQSTGRTPMDEVRRIRLERARDLVISTDLTFNEIATKTGLNNEYHLSRIFKKYLQVPPGYFRKNH
ncbi:MAG: AraC family transcriptional regulator [Spirochaetaceae bacterium]